MVDIKTGRLTDDQYKKNFQDKQLVLSPVSARIEADRCFYCDNAPCTEACPTAIDVPGFINMIASGNRKGAARLILRENIMGATCARVCPTETLCEQACVRNDQAQPPVNISALQRFATDLVFEGDYRFFTRTAATVYRIAVAGAGPAGLACAHALACLGHDVVIYEANEKSGGLNTYGLAAYKINAEFAQKEIEWILSIGGIEIRHGKRLGQDFMLADLEREYDAVFLAMGLGGTNELGLPQEDVAGCIDAVEYIADLRDGEQFQQLPIGRHIVVIGGGMTAIDIAIQSRKLGAESVTLVYRRAQGAMAASEKEQRFAQTNGVRIICNAQPKALHVEDGQVYGVRFEYTRSEDGRLQGTGETFDLDADMVFKAIGQTLLVDELEASGIRLQGGRIVIDDDRRTSKASIWAGGDCVTDGEDLTVSAVQDGKLAAHSIHRLLDESS